MYRVGDFVLVNRWPTSYLVRDYCYVAEIIQVKEEASPSWTSHGLDQIYYKIKPWVDTGMLHDISEGPDIEKAALLREIKSLSSRCVWMGHNHLSPLRYNEETGEYEMAYNDDDLESWEGC